MGIQTFRSDGASQGGALIAEIYHKPFVDGLYRNNEFLGLQTGGSRFFPTVEGRGGRYKNWLIRNSGNLNVTGFTEGQVSPDPWAQSFTRAYLPYSYFWAAIRISGIAEDAMKSNHLDASVLDLELSLATSDIIDLVNTTFLNSASVSLDAACDSTGTYGSIDKGANTWWASYEYDALSTSISYGMMSDALVALLDAERGARPQVILMSPTQLGAWDAITASMGVKQLNPSHLGLGLVTSTFGGIPIVALPDLSTEKIYFLDSRNSWELSISRPFRVDNMGRSGDDSVYQISTCCCLACLAPARQGKISGLAS